MTLQSYAGAPLGWKERLSGALGSLKRAALVIAGTLAVALGVAGLFIPLLPTTPLLLFAAACYAASSKRFYTWLTTNRLFGAALKSYREGRGLSIRVKVGTLSLMWSTMGLSIYFFIQSLLIKALILAIGVAVSAHVLSLKTMKEKC